MLLSKLKKREKDTSPRGGRGPIRPAWTRKGDSSQIEDSYR